MHDRRHLLDVLVPPDGPLPRRRSPSPRPLATTILLLAGGLVFLLPTGSYGEEGTKGPPSGKALHRSLWDHRGCVRVPLVDVAQLLTDLQNLASASWIMLFCLFSWPVVIVRFEGNPRLDVPCERATQLEPGNASRAPR